jgi:hypothetical protein
VTRSAVFHVQHGGRVAPLGVTGTAALQHARSAAPRRAAAGLTGERGSVGLTSSAVFDVRRGGAG